MSARVRLVEKAPKENGIDDQCRRRMQKVMSRNPEWVVEVHVVKRIPHCLPGVLGREISRINKIDHGKEEKRKVRYHRSPQKGGFGELIFCTKFLFDGSVDEKMRGDGVHGPGPSSGFICLNTFINLSTVGLSVGSWLGLTKRRILSLSTMKSPPSWEVSSPWESYLGFPESQALK